MIRCRDGGGLEGALHNGILRCRSPIYSFIYLFPYSVQTDLLTAHYTSCQLEPLLYTSLPTEVAILINSPTLKSSPRQARRLWGRRRRRRGPRATPPSTWNNNRSRERPLTGPRFALTAGGPDAIKGPSEGTVVFPCEVAEIKLQDWRETIASSSFCPSKRFFRWANGTLEIERLQHASLHLPKIQPTNWCLCIKFAADERLKIAEASKC